MDNGRRPFSVVLLVSVLALFTGLTVVGFAVGWRPQVSSEEGRGIDGVITYLLYATGVMVVIGHAVLIWFLWRSSGENTTPFRRPTARMQLLWGLIPVVILLLVSEGGVLVIASPVWKSLYIDQPKDPFEVEVIGKQFEWFVRYAGEDRTLGNIDFRQAHGVDNPIGLDEEDDAALDDIMVRGVLRIPVDRPCVIRLRTHDVIHSFFVPHFRVKQDLISGFPTRVKFTPTETGTYELACAELCGLGHYNMKGKVIVMEPDELEAWLAEQEPWLGE